MAQRSHRWIWILFGLLVVLGVPHGCQKDAPTQPEPAADLRIDRVAVDRTVIGPDDSTRVCAWVIRGAAPGTPVPGAVVVFQEIPVSVSGTFSKTEDLTGADGAACAVFRPAPGVLGLVTLKVQAGASTKYVLLDVQAVTQEAPTLEVSTPNAQTGLPADGVAELEISVTATGGAARSPLAGQSIVLVAGDRFIDASGNGVYDPGEQIPADGDRNGNGQWDAEGSLPAQVTTDEHGVARFHYRAGHTVGPVYVKITGAGLSRELTLQQHSLTLVVTLASETRELLADGVGQASLMVSAQDWAGNPAPGIVLRLTAGEPFTDNDGNGFYEPATDVFEDSNGNGRWDAMGTLPSSATTGPDGSATVTYTAGTESGTVTVRVTTTNGFGQSTLQLVAVPPAGQLAVALDAVRLYADGVGSTGGSITVTDPAGGPLAGKTVTVVAGEHFDDVNSDGVFTPGVDRLLDDADGNGVWTAAGAVTVDDRTGADGKAGFTVAVGRVPMQAWIHAAVDGVTGEAPLELLIPPPVVSVTLESAFATMSVSDGGGVTRDLLTATCLTDGNAPAPAGTIVSFTVASGPGGGERLENAVAGRVDAATDAEGKATATLLSGLRIGWARVRATCGVPAASVGIYIAPGAAAWVTCAADSLQLGPNSQCSVRAWVYDAARNPVADGTPVRFRVDEGMVRGQDGPDVSLTKDGVAEAVFTAIPTVGGDGKARVTASTVSEAAGTVECASEIEVSGGPGTACRMTMEPLQSEIGVLGTGASEQTVLRARVYDCRDLPVAAGQPVAFTILQGPGGGETFFPCQCDSAVVRTDGSGIAEVTLKAGTRSGTVLVRANALGTPGVTAHSPVAIAAGPPAFVSAGVKDCNVLTCVTVAEPNDVTALVYDVYHNPVRDGTVVYFTCNYGMVTGTNELGSATTVKGFATGTWYSTGWPECGVVTITASTVGGLLSSPVSFIGSGPASSARFVAPADSLISLVADGTTEVPLRIEVLDANGLPVLPTDVKLAAVYGEIGSIEKSSDGCNTSIASAVYKPPVLVRDLSYSPADSSDDGIGGYDAISTGLGFGPTGDILRVELRTGPASAKNSTLVLAGSVRPGDQNYFTVTVKDAFGNPLGGHRLVITATGGDITPLGITDSYGVAGGLSFTAPGAPGTAFVEVRDVDAVYGGNLILRGTVTIAP